MRSKLMPRRVEESLREALSGSSRSGVVSTILGVLVGLMAGGAYQQLERRVGDLVAIVVCAILIITVVVLYWFFSLRPDQMRPPTPINPTTERRKGLIVLVSAGKLEESAALAAIRFHFRGERDEQEPTLQYLWLIHSRKFLEKPDPPYLSSYDIAEKLERIYRPLLTFVRRLEVEDPDDPAETFQCAQDAYWWATHRLRIAPGELVADITGGTKSMTIGLAYAGIPSAREIQFLKPRDYTGDGRAIAKAGSDPLLIDVNFVERSPVLPTTSA